MRRIGTARPCPWCVCAHGRSIWSEAGYRFVRCCSCGGIFADLTAAEYERARHNVWNEEAPDGHTMAFYGKARERAHTEFLDRNPPTGNRRLLDVGCGLGFFLAQARQRGWHVRGIDASPPWVRLANARLGAELIEVGSVEHSTLPPGPFDLVTVWDVIEHIFDPVPFLADLRALLGPDGRLFIRTPNIAYVYPVYAMRRRILRHDVELGPTNHVVYFTAATMRDALRRAGLRASDWRVHAPPQVALVPGSARRRAPMLAAKNPYARLASVLASTTRGRLVVGSDLDVMCVPDASAHDDGAAVHSRIDPVAMIPSLKGPGRPRSIMPAVPEWRLPLQLVVAAVCVAGSVVAVSCGARDNRAVVSTVSTDPNLISAADLSAAAPGSPARALLAWFQAVQYGDVGAVNASTAPSSTTNVSLAALDKQVVAVGASIARPQIVSTRQSARQAAVRVLLVTSLGKPSNRSIATPSTFTLKRNGSAWLVTDVDVLFPGGQVPTASRPIPKRSPAVTKTSTSTTATTTPSHPPSPRRTSARTPHP